MQERIDKIKLTFKNLLKEASDSAGLENLRVRFLGKKGDVTSLFLDMKTMKPSERKEIGALVNSLKNFVAKEIVKRGEDIKNLELLETINSLQPFDVSRPANFGKGSYHPITLVEREVEEIFRSMGFIVEEFPEVVDEYQCFESINIPPHHPARDMQDTYYLSDSRVLKTHTSAAQNEVMRKYGAPLKAVFPGRCFRNESTDSSHETTFFQMEGMMIGEGVSISNLIYFMKTMLSEIFKAAVKVRLRPGFFPFVEPGFELDIGCMICNGSGCSSCKNSGWIELCPCGMIHPNVLKMGGVDDEKYTGFAFGLGLTRLAMMKYSVADIRSFNSGNLKILSQFFTA
ncbi:MAG: phenylalanine--tRNA ligase subunit alpha [Oscillospiraceae bacterium]|jgi:phenylalanyl-tRNA synthetase alpha chain|nr:phenylalanine--tRNA ligase subunit alpha [Oscillospiraceae bacterium]